MNTEPLPWRTRMSYALTRARTIERQADGLRRALARLADAEEGAVGEAERTIDAMREQLLLAEQLVRQLSGRHG
jgi:hypothetical protein